MNISLVLISGILNVTGGILFEYSITYKPRSYLGYFMMRTVGMLAIMYSGVALHYFLRGF